MILSEHGRSEIGWGMLDQTGLNMAEFRIKYSEGGVGGCVWRGGMASSDMGLSMGLIWRDEV